MLALVLVSLGINLWLFLRIRIFEQSYGIFFKDSSAEPVMDVLKKFQSLVKANQHKITELEHKTDQLKQIAEQSSTRIGFVRFNPFSDTGGDQSFCLAVLNAHGSGWVLSSIHARTGTRVYAKPVSAGRSSHNLSEEESTAVTKALKYNPYRDHGQE